MAGNYTRRRRQRKGIDGSVCLLTRTDGIRPTVEGSARTLYEAEARPSYDWTGGMILRGFYLRGRWARRAVTSANRNTAAMTSGHRPG